MSELQFDVEWESPGGARGDELRATWARLRIDVCGEPVTRVGDNRAGSVRDAVYGPVYPLAEWIATNWWRLLYEIESASDAANGTYDRHHTLSAAAEGFALPALRIHPEGKWVRLNWNPLDVPAAAVRFLSQGQQYIEVDQVEEALRRLVSGVVERLEDQDCPETFLAQEWGAIEASDAQEREFCALAARLGHDPYSLSPRQGQSLIRAAEAIPETIREEFFSAADTRRYQVQARAVSDWLQHVRASEIHVESLQALRHAHRSARLSGTPWQQGYQYARQLRTRLSMRDRTVGSESDLADVLGVDPQNWRQVTDGGTTKLDFLDALVGVTAAGAPRFFVSLRSQRSRPFTLCRALFEYLHSETAPAGIVAPLHSDRQKRNRAFAAEFLAPASMIQRKIRGSVVTEDQVQDLAAEFGTSDLVIRHQIQNHRLARLVEWLP